MRKGGQTEARIANSNVLPFISKNLGGYVYEYALPLRDHLPCTFVSMHQDKLVDPVGCVSVSHEPLHEQFSSMRLAPIGSAVKDEMVWGKAITLFVVNRYLLVVLHRFSPRDKPESHRLFPQFSRFSPRDNFLSG